MDANGDTAWFGWPKSAAVQAEIDRLVRGADLAAEKAAIARLNKAAMDNVRLRADRLLPGLPGLADERLRRRARARSRSSGA